MPQVFAATFDVAWALQGFALALARLARNTMTCSVLIANGRIRNLPANLVAPSSDITDFGRELTLAGELLARAPILPQPLCDRALMVADALNPRATLPPLIGERIDAQTNALP